MLLSAACAAFVVPSLGGGARLAAHASPPLSGQQPAPAFGEQPSSRDQAHPPWAVAPPHRMSSQRSGLITMKGKKGGKPKGDNKFKAGGKKQQGQQEKKSVKDSRMAEQTKSFIYTILKLTKALPDGSRTLIKNINLCFFPGAKIGLVGLNGAGKSTLMKIMAGVDTEYDGECTPAPWASVGYLAQEPELDGATVQESIDAGVAQGRATLQQFEQLSAKVCEPLSDEEMEEALSELGRVQETIEAQDLWELDRTVERAMQQLRCPPPEADVTTLSGGERRRVALARLLLEGHDLLLLDEPTNHLDAQSVAWLQSYLEGFKGTVVAITHDRYFLEKSCGWILELERGEGKPFEGNYAEWLEQKAEAMRQERKADSRLQKTLQSELEWVRSSAKARQTKSKARLARYEEMLDAPQKEELSHSASIYIPPGPRLGKQVVEAKGVRKGFGERTLIDGLTFSLPPGGIVGVVGPNGAGKTTLVRMLTGEQAPDEGELVVGESVKMICVDQSRESLQGDNSVFEELSAGLDTITLGTQEVSSRAYCSWFGFTGQAQQKPLSKLSGGERNRVQLAKVLKSGGNVLLLDEPTNDLDVNTMRSLEEALLDFAGCVFVVSHDRFFLDRIATHILAAEGDAEWVWFEGNYQEYEEDYIRRNGEVAWKPPKFAARNLVGAT
uniref:ABC transporter domain-containing protein n=1 Tax=Emiliania huxleyi TaxID=2903 RepID=A0A7S3X2Q5_EMIHU